MKTLYTIRKYEGDDLYSWAVFRKEDVKGTRGVVFGVTPVVCGCSRQEAGYYKKQFEKEQSNEG